MPWPAQSPDMNPIEHLWAYVKRQLANYAEPPAGINDLWDRVQDIWSSIPASIVENLYCSMPTRVNQLHKVKGSWTSY